MKSEMTVKEKTPRFHFVVIFIFYFILFQLHKTEMKGDEEKKVKENNKKQKAQIITRWKHTTCCMKWNKKQTKIQNRRFHRMERLKNKKTITTREKCIIKQSEQVSRINPLMASCLVMEKLSTEDRLCYETFFFILWTLLHTTYRFSFVVATYSILFLLSSASDSSSQNYQEEE